MSLERNLGGDRLGSGNKMKVALHNYERSTHDLSEVWRSTMNVGTLVPFMNKIALNGDTFDIELDTRVLTEATNTALMGSYKFQADVFVIPMRLYNVALHMNMNKIGMNMQEAFMPLVRIQGASKVKWRQDCLLTYLGIRGMPELEESSPELVLKNGFGLLAYFEIYKNYYANKQEEIGAMIVPNWIGTIVLLEISNFDANDEFISRATITNVDDIGTLDYPIYLNMGANDIRILKDTSYENNIEDIRLYGKLFNGLDGSVPLKQIGTVSEDATHIFVELFEDETVRKLNSIEAINYIPTPTEDTTALKINTFPLRNIEDMRFKLMKKPIDVPYIINDVDDNVNPYYEICRTGLNPEHSQIGLCLKTYQSDVFNNWLNTEWIDGANGINEITAIDTTSGSFKIDSLNLANKVYKILSRIAVAGGSYEDWQEAVYGEEVVRRAEDPMYMGGMSCEIVFDEIVSTAVGIDNAPTGSLVGKGGTAHKKGGNIVIKVTEPSIIMGIASITPRVDYFQGNEWFTNLRTWDDLHKPGLSAIGFQSLITEQMAHWDSIYNYNDDRWTHRSAGKQPAWLNYMTSYNRVFGGFADDDDRASMVLTRRYEEGLTGVGNISNLTTYIDPSLYNYVFSVKDLTAQNFWVQIGSRITARRKMSAKVIGNL